MTWLKQHIETWHRILTDKTTTDKAKVECLTSLTRIIIEEINKGEEE